MNAGCGKSRCTIGSQDHMDCLWQPRRIFERLPYIDIGELSVHQAKAGGRIHPSIRQTYEHCRGHAAYCNDRAREKMNSRSDSLPAIEINPKEDGLCEEGKALERKRHADRCTGKPHKTRP